MTVQTSRRGFLKSAAAAALVIGVRPDGVFAASQTGQALDPFVRISASGDVTVISPRSSQKSLAQIGSGSASSLPPPTTRPTKTSHSDRKAPAGPPRLRTPSSNTAQPVQPVAPSFWRRPQPHGALTQQPLILSAVRSLTGPNLPLSVNLPMPPRCSHRPPSLR